MRQSAIDSPAVQPMLFEHVRHGLRHDHVTRADAVCEPVARERRGRAVDREHRRIRPAPSRPRACARRRCGRAGGRACARAAGRRRRSPRGAARARAEQAERWRRSARTRRRPGTTAMRNDARTSLSVNAAASSGAPTAAQAATRSSQSPTWASEVARYSVPAAVYQASTSWVSHHVPMPRTAVSEARQTSTARMSPTRSRRMGRSSHSVETKPPLRPLGPCPASAGLEHDDVEPRLELLQLPRGPEAEVAAADDDDVGRRVLLERCSRLDEPCLLEPPPVARVPHGRRSYGGRARPIEGRPLSSD